jgi:hypothetical protein
MVCSLWKDFFESGHAADLCFSEGRNDPGEAGKRQRKIDARKVCLAIFRKQ